MGFYHIATKPFILTSLNIIPMLIACSDFWKILYVELLLSWWL